MGRLTFKKRFKHYNPDKETIVIRADDYIQIVESEEMPFGESLHYYLAGEAVDKLAGYEELKERGLIKTVVHGRWKKMDTTGLRAIEPVWNCTACGFPVGILMVGSKFCPNCGAKMDKEKE